MKKLTALALLAATPAMAHPGHGAAASHWFTDPTHIAILFLLGLAIGPVLPRLIERLKDSEDDHES